MLVEGETEKNWPLIFLSFSLFAVFIFGLLWLFLWSPASPIGAGWFLFSFAAGLSMIVLPCTLPLVFVIVPLVLGQGYKKGLGVALAFSLGVTLTLSLYGLLTAALGALAIESLGLQLETVKNWLYALAGAFAIAFALTEIGLTQWRLPSYTGAAPAFIERRGDYLKALLLGLFLGNIGIGCPSPATYVLLSRIATAGDIFYGWSLFFVHAVGRVTPLVFLAVLALIGVNAARRLIQHKETLEKATGWMLVFAGGFILTLGLFGHDWYVYSGIHTGFESLLREDQINRIMAGRLRVEAPHVHGIPQGPFLVYGSWLMVMIWAAVLGWYCWRERKKIIALTEAEQPAARRLHYRTAGFITTLIILLGMVFGWALPHQFVRHSGRQLMADEENDFKVSARYEPPRLVLQLADYDDRPLQGLQISHERLLHLVIVSEDFSVFDHLHPEAALPGRFLVPYSPPKPGRYYLLVVFKHQNHKIEKLLTLQLGEEQPIFISKDLSRRKFFADGYLVSLSTETGETIRAGEETHLRYRIEKFGEPLTDLQPYLGATMHLAVFSADFSYYAHSHGEAPGGPHSQQLIVRDLAHGAEDHLERPAAPAGAQSMIPMPPPPPFNFGPEIKTRIVFPWPGLYKVFGEFQHQGKVIVTDFMVTVTGSAGVPAENH